MRVEIRRCGSCYTYTLQKECATCKLPAKSTKPAKYSPEDKYGHWRRLAKKDQNLNKEGALRKE